MLLPVAVILGLLLVPASSVTQAQQGTSAPEGATFFGALLDGTGRTLSGVPLTVVHSASGQKYETRTDDAGKFSVSSLPPGSYDVQISRPGFASSAGRVVLGAGQQVQREVVPQIASLSQMYNVSPGREGAGVPKVVRTTVPDDPCRQSSAGGCVTPPIRMVEAWPIFPRDRADATGTVEVSARLGTDGFLNEFRVSDGADPSFAAAAIDALRVWEYSPLRLNGVPQEGRMSVTFRFVSGK